MQQTASGKSRAVLGLCDELRKVPKACFRVWTSRSSEMFTRPRLEVKRKMTTVGYQIQWQCTDYPLGKSEA